MRPWVQQYCQKVQTQPPSKVLATSSKFVPLWIHAYLWKLKGLNQEETSAVTISESLEGKLTIPWEGATAGKLSFQCICKLYLLREPPSSRGKNQPNDRELFKVLGWSFFEANNEPEVKRPADPLRESSLEAQGWGQDSHRIPECQSWKCS
jgi:hypothetical protein